MSDFDWQPDPVIEDLGFVQVVFDGVDVTWFRGIPTLVRSWSSTEPFDDAAAQVDFQSITVFETPPAWFAPWKLVDLIFVFLDADHNITGSQKLFEGLMVSHESTVSGDGWMTSAHIVGALYQADFYVALPPTTSAQFQDIGVAIPLLMNNHPNARWFPFSGISTGIQTAVTAGGNPVLTGAVQDILGRATTEDGSNQWTLMKKEGRIPEVRLKDVTTHHWTVTAGTPGIEHSLTFDQSSVVNVIYGEGVDVSGCHWRNTKYPRLKEGSEPTWPGCYIGGGSPVCDASIINEWEQAMLDQGYANIVPDGVYSEDDANICRWFQGESGLTVDGIVGPQTWGATFHPGLNGGSLEGVFYMPLANDPHVIPYLYNPEGSIIGNDPSFIAGYPRIERWENFGANISKEQARISAISEIIHHYPGFVGTLTLKSDPDEGSRYLMKAGQNIYYNSVAGRDLFFHISQVQVDLPSETVTLTVDERARDLMTLNTIWARAKEPNDPARRTRPQYRNSRQTEDRVVIWDCEGGSGHIARMGIQAELWNVLRIPAGQRGTVASFDAYTDDPSKFAIGVFDRAISPAELSAGGSPMDVGYWDQFGPDTGLIIAWGAVEQMAGYYPGLDSEGAAPTGVFRDDASWYFESQDAPWLWVAFWCDTTTYIQGDMKPGVGNGAAV